MTKNLREEIIKTARNLLLEKAYDEVSMREIAKILDISVGNLTYYFNKKETLAEVVVEEMFERYMQSSPCKDLQQLDAVIVSFEKAGAENSFYFKDFERLSQISGKIKDIQQNVFKKSMLFWQESLKELCLAGFLQKEGFKGQFDAFIHNFYLIMAHWKEQVLIEKRLGIKATNFRHRAWSLIYPMLTDNGKQILLEQIKP